eukprot:CAMPEP_0201683330 /NCGR_PEP_ID=MMETSP0494-20130426/52072_1 /ASSEMBLY_ACC=CAM_ASM_000839 /TAXON_ID=420259 /ORGANISM="Thalassiosira gravida, Strain GMp14c1" /LENGTH=379 /DNA_ID=CAMNT_0048167105 /DNA_START=92 /DNA_END=1231 /DNA_ORIENTATION=+
MLHVYAILFSTAHLIASVHAFHQPATTPSWQQQQQSTGLRQQTSTTRPHLRSSSSSSSQLRLAKRRVTPTKKSRKKKKQQSLESLLELELDLHDRGYRYVIGSDDSGGAGCIAGSVVVASCCLLKPHSSFLPITATSSKNKAGSSSSSLSSFLPISATSSKNKAGSSSSSLSSSSEESLVSPSDMEALAKVNDCKELTPTQRQEIYDIIHSHPEIFAITVAHRSPKEIDDINLTRATQEAFAESIETLVERNELPFEEVYAIVDGKVSPKLYASRRVQYDSPEDMAAAELEQQEQQTSSKVFSVRPYVNGDAHVYTVALASVVARVARDAMMQELDKEYPMYGFSDHAGYGRRDHIETLHRLGSLEGVHRMSFKQVKGH